MSLGSEDEDSLGAYIKQKNRNEELSVMNEDEFEKDKKKKKKYIKDTKK